MAFGAGVNCAKGASADMLAQMRMKATHVGIGGDHRRALAATMMWQYLDASDEVQEVIREMREADCLEDADIPEERERPGFGDEDVQQADVVHLVPMGEVPEGMRPDETYAKQHLERAAGLKFPGEAAYDTSAIGGSYKARMNAELQCAVRMAVRLGDGHGAEMERRAAQFEEWGRRLDKHTAMLRSQLAPEHIRHSQFEPQHVALFACITVALGLMDVGLPARILLGCNMGGDMPWLGTWDEERKDGSSVAYDSMPHDEWNRQTQSATTEKASANEEGRVNMERVWKKTMAEHRKGLNQGPFTYEEMNERNGEGFWRVSPRHAVEQPGDVDGTEWVQVERLPGVSQGVEELRVSCPSLALQLAMGRRVFKVEELEEWQVSGLSTEHYVEVRGAYFMPEMTVRVVDDLTKSLLNDSVWRLDKIRMETADFPIRQGKSFIEERRRQHPELDPFREGFQLGLFLEDIGSAFRINNNSAPGHQSVSVEKPPGELVEPVDKPPGPYYFEHHGSLFGGVAIIYYFSALMWPGTAVCRRLLACPTSIMVDDVIGVVEEKHGDAAQRSVGKVFQTLGTPFKLAKKVRFARVNKFKGVFSDFEGMQATRSAKLYVSAERKRKIARGCELALESCTRKVAESLVGKVRFSATWSVGRAVVPALQPLHERAADPGYRSDVTRPMKRALEYLKEVVPAMQERVISLECDETPPLLIYSYAMQVHEDMEHFGKGAFVVVDRKEDGSVEAYVSVGEVPEAVTRAYRHADLVYAGQFQLLFAAAVYQSCPESVLRGKRAIHFVDNLSATWALVKGYSTYMDSGLIVNAVHAMTVRLNCEAYYAMVQPACNLAALLCTGWRAKVIEALELLGVEKGRVMEVTLRTPGLDEWQRPIAEWLVE